MNSVNSDCKVYLVLHCRYFSVVRNANLVIISLKSVSSIEQQLEMTNSTTKMKLMLLALCVTFIRSQEESISPYEEIKKFVKTFKPRGRNASTYYLLSIDEKHNNLIVGARNNVFLVNLGDMESYEYWNIPQQPGDNAFVKMMLPFGDRILLCWVEKPSTGSCTWRNVSDHELDYSFLFDYFFKTLNKFLMVKWW
ncbi:PREDICTED: uncharacterized protein LOC107343562 [Acropora digitifera]|uniref:uncharacterized protein LOC107343562 n=1 Tax=Acropora digitifera TaxID=70779 RepID=UPI00077A1964|nr:PREDICTED: uncharacterized protein LOC107343562 [Acropora digitifera]